MIRSTITTLISVVVLHSLDTTNAFRHRQFAERLDPVHRELPVIDETVFTRETLTLTPSQIDFIDSRQDVIHSIEENPSLVIEHRHDEFIPLTTNQQRQIFRTYGQFFQSSSEPPRKEFHGASSGARLDIMQAEGFRVCPVSSDWSAITLAFTTDNNLVQVVQLPELSYQQLVFEEKCLSESCQGVANSRCVAVPRYVRACVVDLATNDITISDIQVDCCACHIPFPWQIRG